ncbi:MAG: OB-fold nucleic acid binding domain-containing protein, partial [bacterium]
DFYNRVDTRTVNKKVVESLIKAGAFDSFAQGRAFLLSNVERMISRMNSLQKERANGQESLFGEMKMTNDELRMTNEGVIDFTPEQLLRMEKELLGLYISSHPLERVKESLDAQTSINLIDIPEMNENEQVKAGGILSDCKRIVTKKGDAMMSANLEDLTGTTSIIVFPKAYEKCSAFLNNDDMVIVKGRLSRDFRTEELKITVEEVEPLIELEKVRSLKVELIDISDHAVLAKMKEVLALFRGNDPVVIRMDGRSVALGKNNWVEINPDLIEQLETLLGRGAVNVEFKVQKKVEVLAGGN